MAAELDVNAPWNHSRSVEWDSETLQSWMNREMPHSDAQFLLTGGVQAVFSTEPREQSLLYTLSIIASAGNATTRGTFERLVDVTGGAQERRLERGAHALADRLAINLGIRNILFRSPVTNIELKGDNYFVVSSARVVLARHVIVAMSPPLASRITYFPLLPPARDQLTQRMPMGSIGKIFAIYFRPFWRKSGLNGQILSDTGAVRTLLDSSPDDGSFGAMLCFMEADEARRLDRLGNLDITEEITRDLIRYLGPEAINVSGWDMVQWDHEMYSRGGPAAYAPPGVLTAYGTALRAPYNRIHFAGTETSDYWIGYMDGAVRSGERVAAEVLANW
ncbi:flavin-containing amine oxidoreductase-domain containing protein [Aspergillus leporis]|uniref:Amine oxidase n=1 Tax=Aspergillus leporis TaxID=41062 RepID=A0A5N5X1Z2_9EURO|nr:flavin-containing amine oxidoreductase-domain containing protein [Aspergillus leporis]